MFIQYLAESCLIEYSWKPLLIVADVVDDRFELENQDNIELMHQVQRIRRQMTKFPDITFAHNLL